MIFLIKNLRKHTIAMIFSAVFILIVTGSAYAESLFLKDGSITEGSVVTETDKSVKFKFADGKLKEIPRIDILRVLHHTDYNQKRYIYKTDTSLVEAFIVDEDKLTYTYRIDLNSPNEFKMLKNEIETISKKKLEFASDKKEKVMTREENLTTRAPRIRIGAMFRGPLDSTKNYAEALEAVLADIFIYRHRNAQGNGIDVLMRGTYVYQNIADYSYLGYSIPSGYTVEDSEIQHIGMGAGLRYIHGWYAGGLLWQGYALAYYQYSQTSVDIYSKSSPTNGVGTDDKFYSHGVVGGIGLEIGLFSYFGIFGEYTNGYSKGFPAGRNTEVGCFRLGVTLRTSYL